MSSAPAGTLLDRILERNLAFVRARQPNPLPAADPRRLAVVACYDPRLDALLMPALGLEPGEAFLLRTAGALVQPSGGVMRSLGLAIFMFEATDIVVVGHTSCRMATFKSAEFIEMFRRRGVAREAFGAEDLREWAGAISDPRRGVETSIRNIASASFFPSDVRVSGFVLDDTTGALELVGRGEGRPESRPRATPVVPGASEARLEPAADSAAAIAVAATPADSGREEDASPALGLDVLMAWVASYLHSLESKDAWREEVRRLRRDLASHPSPMARLRLVERLARKASGESKQMAEAFQRIDRAIQGSPEGRLPGEVLRFFQRFAGGRS